MAAPEVRYCTTTDGVRIAYSVEGSGPALVVAPYFVESFSVERAVVPEQDAFYRRIGEGRQIIRYDGRGTGLSRRDLDNISLETMVHDLTAVVTAAGLKRISLFASLTGGPRAIAYAVAEPRKVHEIVLHSTYARGADVMTRENAEAFAALCRSNWPVAAQALADLNNRSDTPHLTLSLGKAYAESSTGDVAARTILAAWDADVSAMLSRVEARTLVVHSRHDVLWPFVGAQHLAANIPRCEFVPLEGFGGMAGFQDAALVASAVEAFFTSAARATRRNRRPARTGAIVTTVLFTDLVGHTEMMRRLGDERGREVLREHERITREMLAQHGGEEIKTMGDGFMASFTSVTKAVDCAIALQRAFSAHTASMPEPLHVRVGLNAGEPIEEDGDLFGSTVIIAARVAAQAGPGEILIPEPLRHLLSGKSYVYSDRGDVALKGFEDAVRLYEVRWQE